MPPIKAQKTINITKSRLVATIAGGAERVVSSVESSNITLDASGSYNPDGPPQSLRYDYCVL